MKKQPLIGSEWNNGKTVWRVTEMVMPGVYRVVSADKTKIVEMYARDIRAAIERGIVLEQFPKSERTFIKRIAAGQLGFTFRNDGGHPCEYIGYDHENKPVMMVKYYRGRLLTAYTVTKRQ